MIDFITFCGFLITTGLLPQTYHCDPAYMEADMVRAINEYVGFEDVEAATEVAFCESARYMYSSGVAYAIDGSREGDNGLALGMFQIHPLWEEWARANFGVELNRRDPVHSAYLALLIGRHYSLVRGQTFWHQWTCKPGFVKVVR